MWWVKDNHDHSRGGFQDRDVGRTSFDRDFGPDYGVDFARFADTTDLHADAVLTELVHNRLVNDFPGDYQRLEVIIRNGFVILKGKVLDGSTIEALSERLSALPGVRFVITKLTV